MSAAAALLRRAGALQPRGDTAVLAPPKQLRKGAGAGELLVFVQFETGDAGPAHAVELAANATAGDLRAAAAALPGAPVWAEQGRLLWQGAELRDWAAPLADLGVTAEAVVQFAQAPSGWAESRAWQVSLTGSQPAVGGGDAALLSAGRDLAASEGRHGCCAGERELSGGVHCVRFRLVGARSPAFSQIYVGVVPRWSTIPGEDGYEDLNVAPEFRVAFDAATERARVERVRALERAREAARGFSLLWILSSVTGSKPLWRLGGARPLPSPDLGRSAVGQEAAMEVDLRGEGRVRLFRDGVPVGEPQGPIHGVSAASPLVPYVEFYCCGSPGSPDQSYSHGARVELSVTDGPMPGTTDGERGGEAGVDAREPGSARRQPPPPPQAGPPRPRTGPQRRGEGGRIHAAARRGEAGIGGAAGAAAARVLAPRPGAPAGRRPPPSAAPRRPSAAWRQ